MPKRKNPSANSRSSSSKRQKVLAPNTAKQKSKNAATIREIGETELTYDNLDATFCAKKYASILKPLRDLSKSFDIDLVEALSKLSDDISSLSQANQPVNFSEAAMVIQSCCNIYSKRVDHLYNQVYKLSKHITDTSLKQQEQQQSNEESESDENEDEDAGNSADKSDNRESTADDLPSVTESSALLAKVKQKAQNAKISSDFKLKVFMTKSPQFSDDFLPLPIEEKPAQSLNVKPSEKDSSELKSPDSRVKRSWEEFFQGNANKTCNYTVFDGRGESIGKRSDFYPQSCWIESKVIFLSQQDLPPRSVQSMFAINTQGCAPFGSLDLDRPVRVLTPGSYRSCVNSAVSPAESYRSSQIPLTMNANQNELELGLASPTSPNESCRVSFFGDDPKASTLFLTPVAEDEEIPETLQDEIPLDESISVDPLAEDKSNKEFSSAKEADDNSNENCTFLNNETVLNGTFDTTQSMEHNLLEDVEDGLSNVQEASNQDPDFIATPVTETHYSAMNLSDCSLEPDIVAAPELDAEKEKQPKENASLSSSPSNFGIDENSNFFIKSKVLSAFADTVEQTHINDGELNKTVLNVTQEPSNKLADPGSNNPVSIAESSSPKFITPTGKLKLDKPTRKSSRIRKKELDKIQWPEKGSENESPRKKGRFDISPGSTAFDRGTGRFISDSESSNLFQSQEVENLRDDLECCSLASIGRFPSNKKEDSALVFENPHSIDLELSRPLTPLDLSPVHILDSPPARFQTPEPSPVSRSSLSPGVEDDEINLQPHLKATTSATHKQPDSPLLDYEPSQESSATQGSFFSHWEDRIMPLLRSQEKRPKFDIAQTSRKVVQSLKQAKTQKKSFTELFEPQTDWYEVTRVFVSCLGLASTGNIEISNASKKKQSSFDVQLVKNQENFTCKELLDIPSKQQ